MRKIVLLTALAGMLASPAYARCHATPKVIVMYTTVWCQICHALQHELTARRVPYATCDIEEDENCALTLDSMDLARVSPTTIVCNTPFVGYDPDGIEEAYSEFKRTTHPDDY
jgi:glutaredoxin